MDFNERDFAAFNSVSDDGDQSELHHGCIGVKEHRLRDGDVEVIAVKRHAEIAVPGVGFQQGHDLLFLAFNDLDDLETVLQGLSCHGVVVINAGSASGQVGKVALAVSDVHGSANVQ